MIYVCAGLYAEGKTDYDFLLPLITRLLDSICSRVCPGAYEIAPTVGIDAAIAPDEPRAHRIASAVDTHWSQCTLFVVHTDGGSAPQRARTERVEPGLRAARRHERADVLAAPCIPVRETEAWMLVDQTVFEELGARDVQLPRNAERVRDPKAALAELLREAKIARPPSRFYSFFGERTALDRLRATPSFNAFEKDLEGAVRSLARTNLEP
ncbi:MAG: DUF4276 family protein [Polyangiaceae bacterium]